MREAGRFLLFCIGVAVAYGIAHDLVTANLAVEYFTEHHPKLVASESPFVMALVWGVLATWWFGGGLGLVLVAANCLGVWPRVPWPVMRLRVGWTTVVLFALAMAFLIGLFMFANTLPSHRRKASFEHDRNLVVAASTHVWSYGTASIAVGVLALWTLRTRARLRHTCLAVKMDV